MGRTPEEARDEFLKNAASGNDSANDELARDLDNRPAGPVIESR